ncbi:MAG: carboxylesterase family protein [Clostridiales bacterium]|nr:carboxylesterase family protein [Clostridiales bacterium]
MTKQFKCNEETIVTTTAGKLQGFQLDGTYTFHGIKYADAKRFQAPQPVAAWEGVKPALSYGYVSPMLSQDVPNGEHMVLHRYWPMDENCQYLNVWTQSLDAEAKKPVMVWLHGGGFSAGSSIEQQAYDGENMSRSGDVVVVTINHRLNILGYLDLSAYGEKYANSANAGNADMVAALQWVHDNIANFGGDPGNVTIFGQSGGGMKVWNLLQTPAAAGLFHKGIIPSGRLDGFLDRGETGTEIVEALLAELGFAAGEAEKLEDVPYHDLAEAYNKVSPALSREGNYVGGGPVPNEFYIGDPRLVGFCDHAKTIPVMIGTVFGEFAFGKGTENKYSLTREEILPMVQARYGEYADTLVALFEKAYPEKNLSDLLYVDTLFRKPTIDFVAKRSLCTESPVFSYLFAFDFPLEGGKPAWHCSEIPFTFHTTDRVPVCNVPGVSDRLEEQVFGAWVSFACYGNPGTVSLPAWPACAPGDEATMIFDRVCEVRHNFDHELIEVASKRKPKLPFLHLDDEDEEEENEGRKKEDVIFLH